MLRIAVVGHAAAVAVPAGDRALCAALARRKHCAMPAVWSDAGEDWSRYDAAVIRSCWDYHLRPAEFLDWIGGLERAGVAVVNAPELIRWNVDKRYLMELSRAGVMIPDTICIGAGESGDVSAICSRRGWQRAVIKPLVSASAHQTELRTDGIVNGPRLAQEFLPEIETSGEWSLMFFGGAFSHAVLKRPAAGDFRVQKEFGGSVEQGSPQAQLIAFAEHALSALPAKAALARVDVVDTESRGPLLMEMEVIEPDLFLTPGAPESACAAAAVIHAIEMKNGSSLAATPVRV